LPDRIPEAVGLKVILIVHESSAAKLAPQVLVCTKSPVTDIAVKLTVAPPWLVTFKVLARLTVPSFCGPNFNLAGETDNAPGVAVAVGVAETGGVAVRVAVVVEVRVAVGVAVAVGVLPGVAVRVAVRDGE